MREENDLAPHLNTSYMKDHLIEIFLYLGYVFSRAECFDLSHLSPIYNVGFGRLR